MRLLSPGRPPEVDYSSKLVMGSSEANEVIAVGDQGVIEFKNLSWCTVHPDRAASLGLPLVIRTPKRGPATINDVTPTTDFTPHHPKKKEGIVIQPHEIESLLPTPSR